MSLCNDAGAAAAAALSLNVTVGCACHGSLRCILDELLTTVSWHK